MPVVPSAVEVVWVEELGGWGAFVTVAYQSGQSFDLGGGRAVVRSHCRSADGWARVNKGNNGVYSQPDVSRAGGFPFVPSEDAERLRFCSGG